jgi:hypothetical protein
VPVAIARTGTSKYIAFNLACPHQGVIVARNEKGWVCSAHLSYPGAYQDLKKCSNNWVIKILLNLLK